MLQSEPIYALEERIGQPELFNGRHEEMALLQKAKQHWQNGFITLYLRKMVK